MNNFLRAQLRLLPGNSVSLLKWPYVSLVGTLVLMASMLSPVRSSAQFSGFSNGALVATTPLVCSGNSATITFNTTTCNVAVGPNWTANYLLEESTDGGFSWLPAPGASFGTTGAATPTIVYTSPVLTTTTCVTRLYRMQLSGIVNHCIPGNVAFTSPNVSINLCPTPDPITGPGTVCVGSTITAVTTSTGGTWTSAPTGVATVNATTGVVGGVTAGTATISYTVAGCSSTRVITVNATPVITGTSVVCLGTTATFTTTPPIPGTWSSTNAAVGTIDAATGVYTASATTTGTSTISYLTNDGCGAAHTITVNPIPDPIGCFGSSTMCFGDTMTLCNTTGGGVWSSSAPGIITVVNSTTGVITPTSITTPGTATISYTVAGCSATHVFTVSAGPTSLTGPTVMCEGATVTLTGAPGGGVYTDGSGGLFAVNPTTGAVTALPGSGGNSGLVNYSIGSCNITHSISVNITPSAIVGGPNLCVGQTVTFTSTPAGGLWTMSSVGPSPITPIGVLTGITTATTTGTATITYTLPSTGCRTTTVVTVGVAPDTITGPTLVCQNSTISLCNTTFGGDWGTIPGGTGAGTVSPTFATCTNFTGTAPGTVIVTYSLSASGCFTQRVVTVDPAPTPITGPDYICSGQIANYASSPGAGMWTVINGTGGATITPATGVATGGPVGTVTIRYTLPNTCNVSRVVTVAASPTPITGITSICVGQTTNLTSSPLGGTWYGTDTSVAFVDTLSGLVTGRSPGAIIATYVLQPQGCYVQQTVTINPLPPSITGPSGVCLGECVTLSNSLPGGTWSSSIPSRGTIANPSVGTVCGVGVGTTNISYTAPGTGCVRTMVFTVHPLPLDISGTFQVCVGNTTLLGHPTPGGTWTSGNPSVAPIDGSGLVTGMLAGTANITYTLPTGCDTFVTVTVNPLPSAITGGLTTCVGSCRTLTGTPPGGTWATQFPAVATVHPILGTLCGVSVGTTFITYTLPTGCFTVSIVTVDPTPPNPVGLQSICVGSTTTWTHAIPGGTWTSSDTTIAKVFVGTGLITGMSAGTANITYTTATGCATFLTITVNPVPPASTGILYLCVNNTTTLSNTMAGGTWQSGNTAIATVGSNTGVVTGIGPGTVNISYIMPSGCAAVSVVTVYPIPTITGSVLVCPGVASTLNATPTGGLWASSPTSVATIGSLTGVVMGVTPGTVNVTYILASTCMAHVTATVQPLPAVITGPTQVCVGSNIQLFNFTGGGGTWSSGNTAVGTVGATTGIVTGISAGTVAITFTANTTGCVISTIITVNPLPGPIGGPPTVCVGSTIPLSGSPAGGTWTATGGHTTVGSSTGIVTGVSAGVDTITYTLATGCLITREVTVNPLPIDITGTTSMHVCHGNTTTIFSGPAGGVWSTTATNITLTPFTTGSDTASVVGLAPGTAMVTYTLPSGCFDTGIIVVDSLPGPIGGLMNLCVNDSTTLTNPSPGGTWTSDNIFIAVINPSTGLLATVSAGTVMITYTLPTGCFITGVVTINPTPQPITGPLAICVNDLVTLSNVTTGGTWLSSLPSVATIGSASGDVTGVAPGTTVITYTLPSSCYRTAILTVNPLPTIITGTLSICRYDTTMLASSPAGGTWSSSAPGTAFIFMPTGQMIGIAPGTAVITYTLPTGCMRMTTVTINPIPPAVGIGGPRVLCLNQTGTLTPPVGFVGTWSSTPTTVATINPTTGLWGAVGVVGGLPTTATITFVSNHGCDTFITVTVNPLPSVITGPTDVCVGNTITLNSTPAGGSWSGGLATVGTIDPTSGVFTGIGGGATIVTYSLPGTGCFVTHTISVHPNPNPIQGTTDEICLGDTVFVYSPSSPGGTWVTNLPSILDVTPVLPGLDTARVIGVGVGTAIVSHTLSTGCFAVRTITVRPLPNPIVGPDSVCLGSSITLSSSPSTGPGSSVGTWSSTPAGRLTITTVSTANDTVSVMGMTIGTARITYANDYGCIVTDSVRVMPLPTVITGTFSICAGFTATLTSTPAGGTWTVTDTTLLSTIATIDPITGVYTGLLPGTATVRYTLPSTCYVTQVITINPIPEIVITSNGSVICKYYGSDTLTATGAGAGGSYSWTPGTGLNTTTGPTVIASPTITTTYTVTGTTIFGCSDTAVVTVWVDSMMNDLAVIGQDSICLGDCSTLIAIGRESTYFEWRPATGLSCVICDTVTACPTVTTIYNALAIDSLGCRDSVYFTLTVLPLPVLSVNPNPIFVCNGRTATATVMDLANDASTKFAWFPNAFISDDTASVVTFSNTSNLIYRVTGITPFGCYDSIKVPVTVLDSAFNSINKDTVICAGSSAQLYVRSFNPDGARSDFYWLNGIPEAFRFIPNPVVSPLTTTTYAVIVTPNVCFPDTLYTTVAVVQAPIITLNATPGTSVAPGTEVTLDATITNDIVLSGFAWSDPRLVSCVECMKTMVTPSVTTTYTFTATSVYGCSDTATITINVGCENSQVYIANSFTPNGDGMNDRFYVQGKGISRVNKFLIFSRWGEMVFEKRNIDANDPSMGWDGQFKDVMLPPGVYYYVVEATCNLGTMFTYKGDVTIVK